MAIRLGMRGRLVGLVAGPTLLVYGGVLGAMFVHLRAANERAVEASTTRRATTEAAAFDAGLREAAGAAQAVADALEGAGGIPRDRWADLLEACAARRGLVSSAAVVSAEGDAVRVTRGAGGWFVEGDGAEGALAPWRVIAARAIGDRSPTWTSVDPGAGATGGPVVRFAVPCIVDGACVGAAAIAIPVAALRDDLGRAIAGDARFSILDREGRFVVGRAGEDEMAGRSIDELVEASGREDLRRASERLRSGVAGVERLPAFRGEPPVGWERWGEAQWIFHAPIASTGWTYLAILPERAVLAEPNRRMREGAVALCATLVLIVGCILFAAGRFTGPIAALAGAVRRIATGDLDHRVDAARNDELGDLAQDVNRMAEDLRAHVEAVASERARSRESLIFAMARLAESRDDDTGRHLVRICLYVEILAGELARDDASIDGDWVRTIVATAALHDIGKVGIPDGVLKKPGVLTDEERAIMKSHTVIGGDALLDVRRQWEGDDFLRTAAEIAFGHHERWDGAGYPFGLAGDDIALSARIVAVADVYDALTSRRCYKAPMPHDKARSIIVEGAGSHFDPSVVKAFEATEAEFRRIAQEHA